MAVAPMIVILQGIEEVRGTRSVDLAEVFKACDLRDPRFRGGLGNCFLKAACRRLDHAAFITSNKTVTFGDLIVAAKSVAAFLQNDPDFLSARKIALVMENCPEYLAGFYGTLLAGGVVIPLPESIEAERLSQILTATGARICLTNSRLATHRTDFATRSSELLELGADKPFVALPATNDDDLAAIIFTSGTTSQAKGVMLSHRNLLANAESICGFLPIGEHDRALALLPFCHAYGNSVLQTHVLSGATLVVDGSTVFPNTIVDAIEQHLVTSLAGVPEMFCSLLSCSDLGKRKLPSLRYMTAAGGPMNSSEAEKVADAISPAEFFVMYGQTEATARLTYLEPCELKKRLNSIGQAIPGVEIEVRDEQGFAVEPGQVGELCARGPNIMLGYWNNDRATSRAINSGWLRTGDLATVSREGFFYLRGRRNEQLKIRGLTVAPRELERILSDHLLGTQIAMVPYMLQGTTRLALFVSQGSQHFSVEQIQRCCAAVLARHELPSYIEVLEDLPRNGAMKTDRQLLTQRANVQAQRAYSIPNFMECSPTVHAVTNCE